MIAYKQSALGPEWIVFAVLQRFDGEHSIVNIQGVWCRDALSFYSMSCHLLLF